MRIEAIVESARVRGDYHRLVSAIYNGSSLRGVERRAALQQIRNYEDVNRIERIDGWFQWQQSKFDDERDGPNFIPLTKRKKDDGKETAE
jgi:hypothetical protein